jgi:hypothetical protein
VGDREPNATAAENDLLVSIVARALAEHVCVQLIEISAVEACGKASGKVSSAQPDPARLIKRTKHLGCEFQVTRAYYVWQRLIGGRKQIEQTSRRYKSIVHEALNGSVDHHYPGDVGTESPRRRFNRITRS